MAILIPRVYALHVTASTVFTFEGFRKRIKALRTVGPFSTLDDALEWDVMFRKASRKCRMAASLTIGSHWPTARLEADHCPYSTDAVDYSSALSKELEDRFLADFRDWRDRVEEIEREAERL